MLNPAGMDAQFERLRCAISRGILKVSGLSQEQLAEKLNLSTNHISSMECGKSLLTTKCLLALCDILGGTPDYYLLGELTPETDGIAALVKQLSPSEQKMLYHLLSAYLANSE